MTSRRTEPPARPRAVLQRCSPTKPPMCPSRQYWHGLKWLAPRGAGATEDDRLPYEVTRPALSKADAGLMIKMVGCCGCGQPRLRGVTPSVWGCAQVLVSRKKQRRDGLRPGFKRPPPNDPITLEASELHRKNKDAPLRMLKPVLEIFPM